MGQAYPHPMQRNANQQMGISFDFFDTWRQETLDPWVENTLDSIGMSQEQIDKIKADAGSAFDDELKRQEQALVTSIIGTDGSAPASVPVTQQITAAFTDLQQSGVVKAIPGGLYTIAGVGIGLIVFLFVRK